MSLGCEEYEDVVVSISELMNLLDIGTTLTGMALKTLAEGVSSGMGVVELIEVV